MRSFALFISITLSACGSSTSGTDGGNDSSSPQDAATQDGSNPSDAAPDVATNDGGLNVGQTCDPNNNQCKAGLLCCNEPTHFPDASTGYFCEVPINNGCPLLP